MTLWLPTRRALVSKRPGYAFANGEAALVAAAFTTPPTTARKIIIDTLVGALKTAAVWSELDVLYLTAAADSQAARINWKNPGTLTASLVNAPAFVADRGFTSDASTSVLNTGYNPTTFAGKFVQNSSSVWVYDLTDFHSASADYDAGDIHASNAHTRINPSGASAIFGARNNSLAGSGVSDGVASSIGFFGSQRRGATDCRGWANGVQLSTVGATASSGLTNQTQWICGASGASPLYSHRQVAAAAWGSALTGVEAAFRNAMLAYMQSVGAA